jgi:hypothetical protein
VRTILPALMASSVTPGSHALVKRRMFTGLEVVLLGVVQGH